MTIDELAAENGLDNNEIQDKVAYLAEFGRVHRDDDTVSPVG